MWIKEIYLLYRYSIVDSIRIHDNKLLLDARKQDTRVHLDIWPKTHISIQWYHTTHMSSYIKHSVVR